MTNYSKLSNVRKLIVLPAALLLLGVSNTGASGETQVHVRGGKMVTRMQNGKMVLTGLKGEVAGGQVHMAGHIAPKSKNENSAALSFTDIPVAKAAEIVGHPGLSAWLGSAMISGYAKGQWQGNGLKEISRTADGTLIVETGPGVINQTAALDKLKQITKISDLPQLRYDSIKFQAHAADGNIVIDKLIATGPDFTFTAAGTYGADKDELLLHIDAAVAPELAAQSSYMKISNVMNFLRGDEKPADGKFVEIPRLIVSGELKKPEVKIDKSEPRVAAAALKTAPAQVSNVKSAQADSLAVRAKNFLLSQAE